MSGLRSAVEELRCEDLSAMTDARLEDDFAELEAAAAALEAERTRRLGEIDRRGTYERDGALSTVAWLASRFGVAWGTAGERVRVARSLRSMPATTAAYTDGDVSVAAVGLLSESRDAHPAEFARDESGLVQTAIDRPLPDVRRIVGHWRRELDEAKDRSDGGWATRALDVCPMASGVVRLDGRLDAQTGECVMTALAAVLDADARTGVRDDRMPSQRRADALGEICRQWLDLGSRPKIGGERPHITVTVGLDTLEGRLSTAELDHAGPIGGSAVRQLACDATVSRVVLGPRSEPLDVGRRTPVISAAMRRAVVVRDRRCRFPGCHRPHTWCDAHHAVHWADGGLTAISNLILLCRRHHRLVHDSFDLRMVDGRPVFTRPDGSELTDDRGPP